MKIKIFLAVTAFAIALVACEPPEAPASATQSAAPVFGPPVANDGGRDGGTTPSDSGMIDAGRPMDGGMTTSDAGPVDAGKPGFTVLSSGHTLPRPWVVTDASKLIASKPLDGGALPDAGLALERIGQLIRLEVPTTNDNTLTDPEHCPSVFMNLCNGFAAKDSLGQLVLVDTFALLGSEMSACANKFNATNLPSISGIWAPRLTGALTILSIAIPNCASLEAPGPFVNSKPAPASSDIQELQTAYPADKPLVTVRGIVTAVQTNQNIRTFYLQDPVGGERSGIQVFSMTTLAPAPSVGDYVTLTANASTRTGGDYNQLTLP
jgi:hypothetical protein